MGDAVSCPEIWWVSPTASTEPVRPRTKCKAASQTRGGQEQRESVILAKGCHCLGKGGEVTAC